MPLTVKQMAEHTDMVQLTDVTEALQELAIQAQVVKKLIERGALFATVVGEISKTEFHLQFVKSALSLMAMTALGQGVDFIAQDAWEVPSGLDRSTGLDPVGGGDVPAGQVDGQPADAGADVGGSR